MEKKTFSAKNTEWKGWFFKAAGRWEHCVRTTLQAGQSLVEGLTFAEAYVAVRRTRTRFPS